MVKTKLNGLISSDYEHPFDKEALDALEGTPGIEYLSKKIFELGIEKMLKIQYTGSHIKVNANNFPKLYDTYKEVCEILNIRHLPDLYIMRGFGINAFTAGVKNAIIVLNSGAIDLLEKEELMFIIGHELGHIKSNHVLYHQMAQLLPLLGGVIANATFGIGKLVTAGLQLALLNWQRMSEFSADRAGLLACQNPERAASAMLKIAGLPKKYYKYNVIDEFSNQAKDFKDLDYNNLNKVAKIISTMNNTHPWTVLRCSEFFKWVDSGEYNEVMNLCLNYNEVKIKANSKYCPNCGFILKKGKKFCGECGKNLIN